MVSGVAVLGRNKQARRAVVTLSALIALVLLIVLDAHKLVRFTTSSPTGSVLRDPTVSGPCVRFLGQARTPKIALLFLTRGLIVQEPVWRLWFKRAADAVVTVVDPAPPLQGSPSLPGCLSHFVSVDRRHASVRNSTRVLAGSSLIDQQSLFSVYAHPTLSFPGFPPGSLFAGREVEDRVETAWGSHTLVTAARRLLVAALKDPRNQRFILLSESGAPLYPPAVIWNEIIGRRRSWVEACNTGAPLEQLNIAMMHPKMAAFGVNESTWRKSSQWFELNREHAELIATDTVVDEAFRRWCLSGEARRREPDLVNSTYDCFSDEHYNPTLLAVHHRERETECSGWIMSTSWTGDSHPHMYIPEEVSAQLMLTVRSQGGTCGDSQALALAEGGPVPPPRKLIAYNATDILLHGGHSQTVVLAQHCPLFMRKFRADTAHKVAITLAPLWWLEGTRNALNRLGLAPEAG